MRLLFFLFCALLLTACATSKKVNVMSLSDLENMKASDQSFATFFAGGEINNLRYKGLEEGGLTIGAQAGLASSAQKIDARLERDKWYLETVYNFNGMMLSHGVLPPVLAEGNNTLNTDDPNAIRISDKTYKIIQQARFATTPPNWRDYLWMSFSTPILPDKFMLPKSAEEQKIWRHAVQVGWQKGTEQSYTIFQQNLARLKRDYQGMILYRKLLQQNMISAPFVAKTNLGVTGNGEDMRINDQVLRIIVPPQLQTSTKHWKAIVVKDYDN